MIYNLNERCTGPDRTIKTETIFRIISEVTEALALNNDPDLLLDTVLETLTRRLNADCCWVQLPEADGVLRLAASRGFTPEMAAGLAAMNLEHPFGQEIIGTGNSIIVPDLHRNGHYDLSAFTNAGFRSLLCVPIMTYRVHGIIGTGYHSRKRFGQDSAALLTAIAGLTGVALLKNEQERKAATAKKTETPKPQPEKPSIEPEKPSTEPEASYTAAPPPPTPPLPEPLPPPQKIPPLPEKPLTPELTRTPRREAAPAGLREAPEPRAEDSYQKHVRRMKTFREAHRPLD